MIAVDAHIRLAAPSANDGVRILRRGYSFADGIDPTTASSTPGLFFIAFQRDPHKQFAAIQRRLGDDGRAERVHPAHDERAVRDPARSAARATSSAAGCSRSYRDRGAR